MSPRNPEDVDYAVGAALQHRGPNLGRSCWGDDDSAGAEAAEEADDDRDQAERREDVVEVYNAQFVWSSEGAPVEPGVRTSC